MGNRAVIETPERDLGIYLHWHGSQSCIEGILNYCKLKGYADPADDDYGWSRLCQVIGNYVGGDDSFGLGLASCYEDSTGDNGVYVIEDWKIKDRYNYFPDIPESEDIYPLYDMLCEINDKQPEGEQIDDETLRQGAIDFYAEMSDEELIRRRNLHKEHSRELHEKLPYGHPWERIPFPPEEEAMRIYDETPGIKEKLASIRASNQASHEALVLKEADEMMSNIQYTTPSMDNDFTY